MFTTLLSVKTLLFGKSQHFHGNNEAHKQLIHKESRVCHKLASHLTMSKSESHTLTHFSPCPIYTTKTPVTGMKNICRKTQGAEMLRYVNLKAYLGTIESPPLSVVGSNSKIDEMSFPSGTDTRVYMTLSCAFRKRARKISCSESS